MMSIAPISLYDVPAQQAWLEDQAARGRFLVAHSVLFAHFYKEEPKAVRYRLEPMRRRGDSPDFEVREVYGQRGWRYVAPAGGLFHIWRCDDPAAPELDTEPEVQGESYRYLRRQNRWLNWFVALMCLALIVFLTVLNLWSQNRYWQGQIESEQPGGRGLSLLVVIVFFLGQMLYERHVLRRLTRTLRAGIPAPRRRPYRLARCLAAMWGAVYLLWLAVLMVNLFQPNHRTFIPVEEWDEPAAYVALADLDMAEALPVDNWRTDAQWWVIQEGARGVRAESRYYRLHVSRTAERLMEDLRRDEAFQPLDVPGLDEAWWVRWDDGDQSLVVRRGKQVLRMHYDGREDLRTCGARCIALFDEFT